MKIFFKIAHVFCEAFILLFTNGSSFLSTVTRNKKIGFFPPTIQLLIISYFKISLGKNTPVLTQITTSCEVNSLMSETMSSESLSNVAMQSGPKKTKKNRKYIRPIKVTEEETRCRK